MGSFAAKMLVEADKQLPHCWKHESWSWKPETGGSCCYLHGLQCKCWSCDIHGMVFKVELPILIGGTCFCSFFLEASFIFFFSLNRKNGLKSDVGTSKKM